MKSRYAFFLGVVFGFVLATPGCAQIGGGISVGGGVTVGVPLTAAATPTFSPAPNIYASTQSVTISDATSGAIIYFTTDGSTPTTSSSVYSTPISVASTMTIQAIAGASGYVNSAVGSAHYIIDTGSLLPSPSSIAFGSVTEGSTSSPQVITLNNTTLSSGTISGAGITGSDAADFAIASTTCGSTLSASSSCTYSLTYSPTAVESDAAVFGITLNGTPYSINLTGTGTASAGPITFNPAAGSYTGSQSIAVSTSVSGAHLFCTTDGSAATEASPEYTGPITVSASETLKCAAATTSTIAQNFQATSSYFSSIIAPTSSQASAYSANYNTPNIKWGPGNTSNGVSGTPTAINFLTNVSGLGDGKVSHLNFTAEDIPGANCNSSGTSCSTQTQVLWAAQEDHSNTGNGMTYQVEDFFIEPAENGSSVNANENDIVDFDTSSGLILTGGLQCVGSGGYWEYSGQTGGWKHFGSSGSVYKNGSLVTGNITEACPLPSGQFTHVQYHVTHDPGYQGCTNPSTGAATECVFIDYLILNNDKYTFGTQTIGGQTYSALMVPTSTLPSGWSSECFNQTQIDTPDGTTSSPVVVGEYIDKYNNTCGTGTAVSASASYTISSGVSTPSASLTGGTYGYMQTPVLSVSTSGASILYTTDNSAPASSSTITSGGTAYTPATPTYTVTSISDLTTKMSAAAPGNVICISAGTYSMTSNIFLSASGAAGNPIIVESCNGTVVLNYTGSSSGNGLFQSYSGSTWGASYWTFQGLTINAENNMYAGFACTYAHHLKFLYNVIANAGGPGITAVHCDYLDSEHNIVFHSGYNQGWASGIDYGLLGSFDSYTGFHNIMAFNVVSGEYDGSHHTDGNGFIIDDGGESAPTNDPATLIVGNVGYGNGGRCIATDIGSNIWFVNNTCYANGLDTAQSTNSEFSASSGTGIFLVNNVAYSWNSNAPYWVFGSTTSPTYSSNYYFGGTNSGTGSSGFTSADPKYINPTAVSSPAYTAGTAGQYANTLSAAAMSNSLWIGATSPAIGAGVNPTTLTSNSNLISDITPYLHVDIDGIVRSSPPAVGAYEYQSGTILFGGPFWLPTNTTVKAIGVKSGLSNSSTLTSSYSITVP